MTYADADYPSVAAAEAGSLHDLDAAARRCLACPDLVASRTQVVPGTFAPGTDVLFLGEAPGVQEDVLGKPFVGKSGQLLDTLLADVGLARHRVAVTNIVKCRPPANRKPRRVEIARCNPWLARQIELHDPLLIIALGGTAAEALFGPSSRIAILRTSRQEHRGRYVLVTYHPSAAIRFGPKGAPLAALREDLTEAARLLNELRAVPQ